jgi:hypothetical protein
MSYNNTIANFMTTDDFSSAGGYGFWCGKKCVERKKAEGKRPKFGKANKAAFDQEQEQKRIAEEQRAAAEAALAAEGGGGGGGGSKMPLIIGGVLVVGLIATVVIVKMRKK